jgi:GNAT superfamily N-acetyltransferase
MIAGGISYRIATEADLPGIARVRTSVLENLLSMAQLAERGITNATVAASFRGSAKGWVALREAEIVGFAIADRENHCLFALFVLPSYEGQGIGGHLLGLALAWLWAGGCQRAWLTTGPNTKAAVFYERRGWTAVGTVPTGDIRYECDCPTTASSSTAAAPTSCGQTD